MSVERWAVEAESPFGGGGRRWRHTLGVVEVLREASRDLAGGSPGRCRPRRNDTICEHGLPAGCDQVHDEHDPCLGEPLCPDCFDYDGALVWNNRLGELWRRTMIYLPRALARHAGITQRRLRDEVRVAYAKVAEYQRRGLVHLHCVIRLDQTQPIDASEPVRPPAPEFTTNLLEQALATAVGEVSAPGPHGRRLRWGSQLDIRPVNGQGLDPGRCAAYIAKYTTKAAETTRAAPEPATNHQVDCVRARDHSRRYIEHALLLAERPEHVGRRLATNARNIGYRGHCFTKSRRYSTSFKRLREARYEHVVAKTRAHAQTRVQPRDAFLKERVAAFQYAGTGHLTSADAHLAAVAAAGARYIRRPAREEMAATSLASRQVRAGR